MWGLIGDGPVRPKNLKHVPAYLESRHSHLRCLLEPTFPPQGSVPCAQNAHKHAGIIGALPVNSILGSTISDAKHAISFPQATSHSLSWTTSAKCAGWLPTLVWGMAALVTVCSCEHERYHGLGMAALVTVCSWNTNVIMLWAWMLWSPYALGTRTLSWFGHGCSGHRMLLEH